ncbi:MAG: ATP-binding protein [Elusimicrobiota bacterium]|jgi:predicted AAA+ superfamily ATPase|nr:ATP-binding protein [Elusimicrobiota bacterium]
MNKKRTLSALIYGFSKNFKILLLTGARQVGKTTLLQNCSKSNRKYVTLDTTSDLLLAKNDPNDFLLRYAPPVLIDEIQYAPEIFNYLKILADNSDKRGLVWMSGSQQFNMMKNVSESLAGRVAIMELFPFSIYEREDKAVLQKPFLPSNEIAGELKYKKTDETFEMIWQGAYPDVVGKEPICREAFYDAYIKTYIERDVRQLVNIGSEITFLTFLKVAAARTGQELNLANIAKDSDISPNTAKQWLSILQASGLVYLLRPYFKNTTKRLIKSPKLYFMDTGLAAYLSGWTTPQSLETGASAGAFFETFVISEVIKSYKHNALMPDIYYFRDNNGNEIDLLIHQDGKFYPIEIKKTATPMPADISAFKILGKFENLGQGALICLTEKVQPLSASANAISIWNI